MPTNLNKVFLLNISFLIYFLFAGHYSIFSQQYSFINYSVKDGLPNSNIQSILQDTRGFLWVGTNSGLTRFNGENWSIKKEFSSLSAISIEDIFEDKNHSLWLAAGENGLYEINGETINQYQESGLNFIGVCDDLKGNIWVATKENGIYLLSTQVFDNQGYSFKPLSESFNLPDLHIHDLINDGDGNIWFGTNKGLCKFDGISIQTYSLFDGLPHNKVTTIFEDNLSRIWFCTPRGTVKYDFDRFTVFNQQSGLKSNEITSISQDISGKMWLGSNEGIALLDGDNIEYISTNNGLIDQHVTTLKNDNSGNIWIGSRFGGVSMFLGYTFTKYTTTEGIIGNQVFSEAIDKTNTVYVGTLEGLNYSQDPDYKRIEFDKISLKRRINTIYIDSKEHKWIGTDAGLYIFKDNSLKKITTEDSVDVHTICEDNNRSIWFAGRNGLYRIDGYGTESYQVQKVDAIKEELKFEESNIRCIYKEKNGTLLFGFQKEGLVNFDGKTYQKIKLPKTNITIASMATDATGNIWCGTEHNGIIILNRRNGNLQIIKELNIETGLLVNKINSILFLDKNTCIVGSNRGIDKLSFDERLNIVHLKKLGQVEGMNSIEVTDNSLIKTPEGKILIGSLNGLIVYDPLQEELNLSPPNTQIVAIKLFFKETDWTNSKFCSGKEPWFNIPIKLNLPPEQNHLTFEFTGINLKSQAQVRYQWKLNPLDINWSPPGKTTEITYSELPPGDYTFYVKSYNEDGTPDIEPAIFNFTIQTPYYQSTWFISLLIVLTIGLYLLFMQWRTRKLSKDKEKLEKEVVIRTELLIKEKELVVEKNRKITQQTEELETQTEKLFQFNTLLQTQNRDITDSISYARTIQKAVLGPKDNILNILKKSFILYRPKDIVSGDFYWFSKHGNYIFVAAVDCTGHGVPGAFMSIIGYNLLKEFITENHNQTAADILDRLNIGLIELLRTHESRTYSKDGMDIALCRIDLKNKVLNFAGAMSPMYWLKNEHNAKIKVVKGDRVGIGDESSIFLKSGFKNHFVKFDSGDRCYLFTDGFVDQFGGKKDKKYLGRRFRENLVALKDSPIFVHETELYNSFIEWKGIHGEQTDDILIIGIEF